MRDIDRPRRAVEPIGVEELLRGRVRARRDQTSDEERLDDRDREHTAHDHVGRLELKVAQLGRPAAMERVLVTLERVLVEASAQVDEEDGTVNGVHE